ncbi:MAG: hypothetical protein ABI315_04000 [Bacteroidia bacterium]
MLIILHSSLYAQDSIPSALTIQSDSSKPLLGRFLLTGNGFINYERRVDKKGEAWNEELSPILLWRISKRFFFETEVAIKPDISNTEVELDYATLHYKLNKFFTLGAGKFLSPFGIFQERLHPMWINKFPDAPLGFNHEGTLIGPMSEIGIELRGGSPLGVSKINYVAYISNGPALNTNTNSPMGGMLEPGGYIDNNKNKALGFRLGFLPFSNSSLELGFSWQDAKVGDEKDAVYKRARAVMHGFDLSYVKSIPSLKSIIDMKGQYNHVLLDKTNNGNSSMGSMGSAYDVSEAYFFQVAVRPALVRKKIISSLELAGRVSVTNVSQMDLPNENKTLISASLNYWFSWRTVVKLSYQALKQKGEKDELGLFIQLAVVHPRFFHRNKKISP